MTPEMVAETPATLLSKPSEEQLGGGLEKPPEDIPDPAVPPEVLTHVGGILATSPLPLPVQADIDQYVAASVQSALGSQPNLGAHEALLQGFCQHLQARLHGFMMEEHKGLMQTLDATLVAMRKWVETVGQHNEHAQYQLSAALNGLHEQGLVMLSPPYKATLTAWTPEGYPITLELAKRDPEALVNGIQALKGWLHAEGYRMTGS